MTSKVLKVTRLAMVAGISLLALNLSNPILSDDYVYVENTAIIGCEAPPPVVPEVELVIARNEEPSRGGSRGSRRMVVRTSAYTAYDSGNSGTGLAYDGRPVVGGRSIAVDPSVIPLGSIVTIPGLGKFLAHDTGGDINGNRIDICMETRSEAFNWGRRTIEVLVEEPTTPYKMAW